MTDAPPGRSGMSALENIAPHSRPAMSSEVLEKLRRRRKLKRLSLKTVADLAGISIGTLSQIERGLSSPSFATIKAICRALEMPLDWLFDDALEQNPLVVRADKRRVMNLGPATMAKQLLTPDSVRGIQMMLITIPPGVMSVLDRMNEGYKCGAVLSGRLGLTVADETAMLEKGDSFAFSATKPHQYWCEGAEPTELIWCVSPAIY